MPYYIEELTPAGGWLKRGVFKCEAMAASYAKARAKQTGAQWRVRCGL